MAVAPSIHQKIIDEVLAYTWTVTIKKTGRITNLKGGGDYYESRNINLGTRRTGTFFGLN